MSDLVNWFTLLTVVGAYVIGSIPTAIWIGKGVYGIDVREHGSGNAGATNTFRVLGKRAGIPVLIIDILKGWGAVSLFSYLSIYPSGTDDLMAIRLIAGVFAVLGHVFPVFARFDGGKGVATTLGVVIALHPASAGVVLGIFLLFYLTTSYVSLGAIIASFCYPFVIIFVFNNKFLPLIVFSVVLALMVILRHQKNIKRLLNKEESKMPIKFKK